MDDFEKGSAADELCMSCGLCCDGTFFGSVVIDDGERSRVDRIGLRVVDREGRLVMPEPCSALAGTLCSVYADRPQACRAYECSLRRRVCAGETTYEVARERVEKLRSLIKTVRRAFDLPEGSLWDALVAIEDPIEPEPMSPAGRKFDAGLAAVAELLTVSRAVFDEASPANTSR